MSAPKKKQAVELLASFAVVAVFVITSAIISGQLSFAQSLINDFTPVVQVNGASESKLSKAQSDGEHVVKINVKFIGSDGVDVTNLISFDIEPDLSVKSTDGSGFQVYVQTTNLSVTVDTWDDCDLVVEPLQLSLTDNSGAVWNADQQSYDARSGESIDVVYRNFDATPSTKMKMNRE